MSVNLTPKLLDIIKNAVARGYGYIALRTSFDMYLDKETAKAASEELDRQLAEKESISKRPN
jgi:hypothetical protein